MTKLAIQLISLCGKYAFSIPNFIKIIRTQRNKIPGQQIPKKLIREKVCLLYISTIILQGKNIN